MKNLKKIIVVFLLLSSTIFAQENRPQKERIESMKIGFITTKLNLTPDEAKVFWPVYNQYSDELEKLRSGRRQNLMNTKENFDGMTDKELEKAVDDEINFRSAEVDIIKKYHPQFKKVLSIRKVALLYKAEEEFKRKLLEMIRDRKGGDKQGGRQGAKEGEKPGQMHQE